MPAGDELVHTSIDDAKSSLACALAHGTLTHARLDGAETEEHRFRGTAARNAFLHMIDTYRRKLDKQERNRMAKQQSRPGQKSPHPTTDVQPQVLPAIPPVDVSGLPAWIKPDSAKGLERAVAYHRSAERCIQGWAVSYVMCGLEFLALKKSIGHGRWNDVVERVLAPSFGISPRMTARYVEVAEGAKRKLALEKGIIMDPDRLLGSGDAAAEQFRIVTDAISQATSANDWRELLEDFRLARPKTRGGFHPPREWLEKFAKLRKLDGQEYEAWDQATKDDFRDWLKEERRKAELQAGLDDPKHGEARRREAAERQWMPFLSQAVVGTQGKDSWSALPQDSRAALRDALVKLAEAIAATL